ncbi:hypothetical protein Hanom_Chr17g01555531 [Helianthus anomalus]
MSFLNDALLSGNILTLFSSISSSSYFCVDSIIESIYVDSISLKFLICSSQLSHQNFTNRLYNF